MPYLVQPGAGEHSTYRSAAGLGDQADNQPDEGLECGSGKARPKLGQQVIGVRRPITDELGKWMVGRVGVGGGRRTD